jgi:hypothetical protein
VRGTGIEKDVEIYATNLANKTKCMNTSAHEKEEKMEKFVLTPSVEKNLNIQD